MTFYITLYEICRSCLIYVSTEPNKPDDYNILCNCEATYVKLIYLSSFQVFMRRDNFERGRLMSTYICDE